MPMPDRRGRENSGSRTFDTRWQSKKAGTESQDPQNKHTLDIIIEKKKATITSPLFPKLSQLVGVLCHPGEKVPCEGDPVVANGATFLPFF